MSGSVICPGSKAPTGVVLQQMVAVPELEAGMISARTKAGACCADGAAYCLMESK